MKVAAQLSTAVRQDEIFTPSPPFEWTNVLRLHVNMSSLYMPSQRLQRARLLCTT